MDYGACDSLVTPLPSMDGTGTRNETRTRSEVGQRGSVNPSVNPGHIVTHSDMMLGGMETEDEDNQF